ncbi:DUF3040 domain-containing protein [Ferrimicrobium acidiphilum]|jgi:hypothetical protein|uniref:DUF3040 domain-containing protein n=1 Tax=Ferrimicrobium acidiphilum DSM 19497 TaxID=1121877 RepID=A0A0D8FVR6_9ACTN|nr:DUF3040 domain-containing protein [Ferrimicrobium acidiphilum]KJE77383.1 hypothetical protein FEAC_08170 [Ferrimicrobium acidiphilum DSM 19497]
MPLNEDEQRILQEIEKTFYENDPEFADRVRSETVYKHSGRNLKWATLGFVVGLAFTILTFTISVVLGAFGFLIMLGSAVYFERNLRRVGRASLQDLSTRQFKQGGFKSMGKKLRGDDQ